MPPPPHDDEERTPLLHADVDIDTDNEATPERQQIEFDSTNDGDGDSNPRTWPERRKMLNVTIISLMAILSPLASSMFTPGIAQIALDLHTDEQSVIATTTGFVVTLGLGPLVWAPLSEDFGRRRIYIICFAVFTVLQVAAALSPGIRTLIVVRTVSGFFGSRFSLSSSSDLFIYRGCFSCEPGFYWTGLRADVKLAGVGIANGGGTISDMYNPSERAGVFGWYLLGPLLGPTLGPLFGGVIVSRLGWRWIYWVLTIVCAINTAIGFLFLRETYTPVLLGRRKAELVRQQEQQDEATVGNKTVYYFEGEDLRPLRAKMLASMKRPFIIFAQPIVLTMSMYQALIFGTTYSIYTNMQNIYSAEPYNFNSEQVGLLYLGPGLGFLTSVRFLVPRIDTVFNSLTEKNDGRPLPEFRLPLANVGSVLIPASLFWFAWTVQARAHWLASISATYFYGIGQVVVFNTVQNYYIDSFATFAASAIAGGSVFRSLVGGVVPLFAPDLFDKVGYGWGISCFAFVAVLIAPSPLLFYYFGARVRERFRIKF